MREYRKRRPDVHRKANKKWKKNNWDKIYAYRKAKGFTSIKSMHKKRFGGLREKVMELYDGKCYMCSMTRKEHKKKWGRDLTLHHIDGQGRYSKEPNNEIDNLMPLCLHHHGKIDAMKKEG